MKQVLISLAILSAFVAANVAKAAEASASRTYQILSCQDDQAKFDLYQTVDTNKAQGELFWLAGEGSTTLECIKNEIPQAGADMRTLWNCRLSVPSDGVIESVNYSVNITQGGITGRTLADYAVIPVPAVPDFYPHAVFGTMNCHYVR